MEPDIHASRLSPGARKRALERLAGEAFEVHARVVVNATGIWTTETERLAGIAKPLMVRPSKGIHLVVPKDCIRSAYALILPTEKSVLFVLPWGEPWIIGTTDTDWALHLDHPAYGAHPRVERRDDRPRGDPLPGAPGGRAGSRISARRCHSKCRARPRAGSAPGVEC